MKKIGYISLFFLLFIFILFILLNKETTRKIGINYNVVEYKIPVYLKVNDFFNRHYNYKYLVKKININLDNKKDIILNTTKWVNQNIQKIPEKVDIVDHHPLTIVHRRLGEQSQFSDILSVLLIYLNVDSFFIKGISNIYHPLTFFRVNNYWSVLDPYYGVYFINKDENFASIEDLKKSKWQIVNLESQKISLLNISDIFLQNFQSYDEVKDHYSKIFTNLSSGKQIDDTNIFNRGGRSYVQKPLNRLKFEIYKLIK
jgi:uncharacterized lipoprotein YehR (DUF1307 family)